jgi:TATA-binding protein-associated factor Taf7
MSDMEDHAYGAYQTNPYQDSTFQGDAYLDGVYQNEGSDPMMPQPDEMEGDVVARDEPRKQKERRRELDEDEEDEGDPEDDDEEQDNDDEEDPGRKKKRAKVCCADISVSNLSRTFAHSIATNDLLPVVSLILKLKSAMRMRTRKMRKTLEEVRSLTQLPLPDRLTFVYRRIH